MVVVVVSVSVFFFYIYFCSAQGEAATTNSNERKPSTIFLREYTENHRVEAHQGNGLKTGTISYPCTCS
uniref:Putative secreted protein n=1 Tax=Ixodes ricinus TaxID=34613 RepID=A0A6B0TR48_IXORI